MAQHTQINPDALVTALTPINNSLGGKQDKTDNTLATTDKTVSGAINEINTKVGNLTGALTWKGKFDTLPAVTDYEAGNVVGVGNKEYVLTVTGSTKAWEELGDEGSYLLKSVAEETYAKKTSIPTVNDPKVSIKMNGAEKGSFTLNQASAGEVDLGTVITAHQDISGKVDKTTLLNTLMVVDLSSTDIAVRKAALDDFKAKWLALGNTDLNGARFIGRFSDANGNTSIHESGKALIGEDTLLIYKQISPAFPTGFYGLSYINDMANSLCGLYQIYVDYDTTNNPGNGNVEITQIRDSETFDWLNRFVYIEAPSTYLKITDAESTYETKTHVAETLRDYAKSEEIPAMGNMATANAITSIKHDLSPVLQNINLTGTDADRKAKLDQFAKDWKELTGANDLNGARFVGNVSMNDGATTNVLLSMDQDNNYSGISMSDDVNESQLKKIVVHPNNGSVESIPLLSHLEAVTISIDNTPESKAANVAAIKAYVDNLIDLGVDTTKGYIIPITASGRNGFLSTRSGNYPYAGYAAADSSVSDFYNILILGNGEYYDSKIQSENSSELNTISKKLVPAINEVNDLAKSKGNGTITEVKMNGASKGTSGVVDLGTVITAHQDISGKQDKLISGTNIKTINGESVLGSGDITISSGASSSAYPEVNHGTGDTTFTLTPNTFHVWDEVTSLTLNFGSGISGVANEYLFQFTSGPTATSLTLPDDIKWANDNVPTIGANMIYQVSVLRGLASVLEFNNAKVFPIIGSTDGNANEEYAKVYEYFINTYNLTNASSIPSSGVIITETLICNDAKYGGRVLKVNLSENYLLLWTQNAIDTYFVPRINNLGVYSTYYWD